MELAAEQRRPIAPPEIAVAALVGIGAAATAALVNTSPLIAVALGGMAVGGWLVLRSVDWATFGVLFCLYANLAVVAVRFHGVPAMAAHAVVGLLVLPLGYYVAAKRQPVVVGPCFPWLATFAVVQGLGVIFAKQPERAAEEFFTFLVESVVLYFLIVNAVRSEQALRGATWAFCLAGILMGGVPLIQQIRGDFENQYGGLAQTPDEPGFLGADNATVQRRMAGPIGEKNRYGQVMLMLLPLSLFRLRDERSPWLRGLAFVTLLFAGAGVYLSFSRSTILCAGLVLLLAAALNHVNRKLVTLAVILGFCGLLLTPQYRARLASLADLRELFSSGKHSQADGALKGRATEMGAAALVFLDHPLIGVGPGEFKFYSREYGERIGIRALAPERQAHCLPLDVAAENGVLGLCCLLGIFGMQGMMLLRQTKQASTSPNLRSLSAGCFYMLAAYAATGLFLHFAFIRYFWLMIALGDAALLLGRNHGKENS